MQFSREYFHCVIFFVLNRMRNNTDIQNLKDPTNKCNLEARGLQTGIR